MFLSPAKVLVPSPVVALAVLGPDALPKVAEQISVCASAPEHPPRAWSEVARRPARPTITQAIRRCSASSTSWPRPGRGVGPAPRSTRPDPLAPREWRRLASGPGRSDQVRRRPRGAPRSGVTGAADPARTRGRRRAASPAGTDPRARLGQDRWSVIADSSTARISSPNSSRRNRRCRAPRRSGRVSELGGDAQQLLVVENDVGRHASCLATADRHSRRAASAALASGVGAAPGGPGSASSPLPVRRCRRPPRYGRATPTTPPSDTSRTMPARPGARRSAPTPPPPRRAGSARRAC